MFTYAKIDDNDLNKILDCHKDNVQDIFPLTAIQKFISDQCFNKPTMFNLQNRFLVRMKIEENSFTDWITNITDKHCVLRSCYMHTNLTQPYCVVLKHRKPEVIFNDFSDCGKDEAQAKVLDLANKDLNRGFNLEVDSPFRVYVSKIDREDTHSLIISQPHFNTDGHSLNILMKEVFAYAFGAPKEFIEDDYSYCKELGEFYNTIDKDKELEFWADYLKDAPEEFYFYDFNKDEYIPGDSAQKFYPIDDDSVEKLMDSTKLFHATMYTVVQVAWAITLWKLTGRKDFVYGSVVTGREPQVPNSISVVGGFWQVLPTRIQIDEDMKLSALLRGTQISLTKCLCHSHCSFEEIQKVCNRKFDFSEYYLNYHYWTMPNNQQEIPKNDNLALLDCDDVFSEHLPNLASPFLVYIQGRDGRVGFFVEASRKIPAEFAQHFFDSYNKTLTYILNIDKDTMLKDMNDLNLEPFAHN